MTKKQLLMAAAFSGIVAAQSSTMAMEPVKMAPDQVMCYGVNACKGQGQCAGKVDHACSGKSGCEVKTSCAGHNSCKGKGMVKMSKKDCADKGGKASI